jgi:hypothetical protein
VSAAPAAGGAAEAEAPKEEVKVIIFGSQSPFYAAIAHSVVIILV